jgi:Tol biopolymer transport system component
MAQRRKIALVAVILCVVVIVIIASSYFDRDLARHSVPHEKSWGIYSLDLDSNEVTLIYTSDNMLQGLSLDSNGATLAFSERFGGTNESHEEICTVAVNGSGFSRLTDNDFLDTYPAWSSDGSVLYFLSWRNTTLDIFKMNPNGTGQALFYDSGYHDADVNVVGDKIVFTRQSRIWTMDTDGTGIVDITNPPQAGVWGNANLPFGDYDPKLSPDGSKIVFERLVADTNVNGNYDLYLIGADGTGETALTSTGYSQGLPCWSHDGGSVVYIVAAINDKGVYHIYMMSSDGANNRDVTPGYFPSDFLCRSAVFSQDDSKLYFIGQWW